MENQWKITTIKENGRQNVSGAEKLFRGCHAAWRNFPLQDRSKGENYDVMKTSKLTITLRARVRFLYVVTPQT